jgi:hypothetical protein
MDQTEFRKFLLFLFHGMEFRLFSLLRRIQNIIPRVPSICSTEQNFDLFSLPQKCSERNSEYSLYFCSTERNSGYFIFCGGFKTKFREFLLFVPRNRILTYFLFRRSVRKEFREFSVPRISQNSVGNTHLFQLFHLRWIYFFVRNS